MSHCCEECGKPNCNCSYEEDLACQGCSDCRIAPGAQVYLVTACGHVRHLAGMKEPECPVCREAFRRKGLAADLMNANHSLSILEADKYAECILWAESREEYETMQQLISGAVYGGRHAA